MEYNIKNIHRVNPALARKMVWFGVTSLVLVFTAWGVNLIVLAYNLLATEMLWSMALTIFCAAWLVIYVIQRAIMAPIGKRLAVRVTEIQLDALEEIGNDMMRCVDTAEYLAKRKGKNNE